MRSIKRVRVSQKTEHAKIVQMQSSHSVLRTYIHKNSSKILRGWVRIRTKGCCASFSHIHSLLEKMASDGRRNRVRLSLGVEFDNQAAKSSFSRRLEYVRSLLTPPGLRTLDNQCLLSALFDHVEGSVPSSFPGVSRAPLSHLPGSSGSSTSLATTYRQDVSVVQSFNSNAGERNSHSYTPFIFQL